jgi:hypothetical protein
LLFFSVYVQFAAGRQHEDENRYEAVNEPPRCTSGCHWGPDRARLGRPADLQPGKQCHLSLGLEAGADDAGESCLMYAVWDGMGA